MIRPGKNAVFVALAFLFLTTGSVQGTARTLMTVEVDPTTLSTDEVAVVTVLVQASRVSVSVPRSPDFEIRDATPFMNRQPFCMNDGLRIFSGPCELVLHFRPLKEGDLEIPSLSLVPLSGATNQALEQSSPIALHVTKGTGRPKRSAYSGSSARQRRRSFRDVSPQREAAREPRLMPEGGPQVAMGALSQSQDLAAFDAFLFPLIQESKVYLNQPVLLEWMLFVTPEAHFGGNAAVTEPHLEGFRTQKVDDRLRQFQDVVISGRSYQAVRLAAFNVVPLELGTRTIGAVKGQMVVDMPRMQHFSGGTGFSIQFSSGGEVKDVYSPPVAFQVQRFPEPQPEGFQGTNVGSFRLLDLRVPDTFTVGAWLPVRFDIEGEGNLYGLVPPSIAPGPGLEVREPYVETDAITTDEQGIRGRVRVHLNVKALRPGPLELRIPEMVAFNPRTGDYERANLASVVIEIEPGAGDAASLRGAGAGAAAVLIAQETDVPSQGPEEVLRHPRVPVILATLAGLLVLALLWRRLAPKLFGDSVRRKRRRAAGVAERILEAGASAARAGAPGEGYAAILRSLHSILSSRLGILAGSMTLPELESRMTAVGVEAATAAEVRRELESAEFARYAPSQVQGVDLEQALERTRQLIRKLSRVRLPRIPRGLTGILGVVVLVTCFAWSPVWAEAPVSSFDGAVQLYKSGDVAGALAAFRSLAEGGGVHPAVWFNLATIHLGRGDLGLARYYFERAASGADAGIARSAKEGIQGVIALVLDQNKGRLESGRLSFDESYGVLYAMVSLLPGSLVSLGWLVLGVLFLSALGVWLLGDKGSLPAWGRTIALSLAVPFVVMGVWYWGMVHVAESVHFGVVIQKDARVLEAPSDKAPGASLAEALKMRILRHNEAGYYLVELSDGSTGYVRQDALWPLDESPIDNR